MFIKFEGCIVGLEMFRVLYICLKYIFFFMNCVYFVEFIEKCMEN